MNEMQHKKMPRISVKQKSAIALLLLLGALGAVVIVGWPQAVGQAEHSETKHEEHGEKHAAEHDDHAGEKAHAHAAGAEGAEEESEKKSEEGSVHLTAQQAQAAGIGVEAASAAALQNRLQLPGEIRLNEDRTAHIVPRLAAVVESAPVNLGQTVKKGQVLAQLASPEVAEWRGQWQAGQKRLALVQATYAREKRLWEQKITAQQDYLQAEQAWHEAQINQTAASQKLRALGISLEAGALNRFELRAPFDGVVIEKHLGLGEAVKEDAPVLIVSDLRQVWVDIQVPAKALPLMKVGEVVEVQATAFSASAKGKVAFVGALLGEQTRTALARVLLDNPQGLWRPGLFVTVAVAADQVQAPVTVANTALQTIDGRTVVFVQTPEGFSARPVDLGLSDGVRSEVKQGLQAGESYAAAGSFVLKAELGKSEAEHEH